MRKGAKENPDNMLKISPLFRILQAWPFFEEANFTGINKDELKAFLEYFRKFLNDEDQWLEFKLALYELGDKVKIEKVDPAKFKIRTPQKNKQTIYLLLERFTQKKLIKFDPQSGFTYERVY